MTAAAAESGAAGRSVRVELDGWDAHVLRWDPAGAGTAGRVVLLHGGGGHAHSWEHLAGALRDGFEVVAIDQRGHGRSGPTDRYGSRVQTDDIGRLLDAVGWPAASLVGHSVGGIVAYLFAAAHPDRTERLVVIDAAPEGTAESWARVRASQAGPDTFATFDEALASARKRFPTAEEGQLRHRVEHNLLTRDDGTLTWRTARELRNWTAARDDHSVEERWAAWAALRVPTLLVHGTDSDALTGPLIARCTDANPAIAVTHIAGAGHSVPLDQPGALAEVTAAFLRHK